MRAFLTLFLCASGVCGSEPKLEAELIALKRAVVSNYAAVVWAAYDDSAIASRQLQSAVDTFLRQPSETSLNEARDAWLKARVPYLQTEVCRFYDGPIDEIEGFINAWPIDENYIDYVAGNPGAGIINATLKYPLLTRALILAQNEKEGERNISTGFHAVEFLLWGQDTNAAGPGARSWTDYKRGAPNGARRGQYLRIVTGLLLEHLETVASAWAPEKRSNYRAAFLCVDTDVALGRILKGMGALSGPELAGERLTVAYETKEQEDEHSCFSDNTHNDVIYDALGIQNVYLGRYGQVRGPGIHDLLAHVDPKFANELKAQIETALRCARSIPPPFDQAILGPNGTPGRVAIKQAIQAFQKESEMIAKAAKLLSIELSL
jgi:putative iron-regulated protein